MKKPILMFIAVILLILTIIFTLQNAEEVEINYFYWNFKASLALLLFITLSVGLITALIILVPVIAHLRAAIRVNNQKKIEQEKNKID